MRPHPRPSDPPATASLQATAAHNLQFIRSTMERASAFTAVPGWGGVAMGASALGAAAIASRQPSAARWLGVWLIEACVAIGIAVAGVVHKGRRAGLPLVAPPNLRFARSFAPAIVTGALLTVALAARGEHALLPGVWMLVYGAGFAAAGTLSIRVIPLFGASFMLLGAVTLLVPALPGDVAMAVGFGGLHLAFGWVIARRHGG
jgi:hypothetical protein